MTFVPTPCYCDATYSSGFWVCLGSDAPPNFIRSSMVYKNRCRVCLYREFESLFATCELITARFSPSGGFAS